MADLNPSWGSTYPIDIAVTLSGVPVNLTGKSLKLMAKYQHEDADAQAVFSLAVGSGIALVDAPNGLARATLTPSMFSSLNPAKVYQLPYELRLIDGSNVYPIAGGTLTVSRAVVRNT